MAALLLLGLPLAAANDLCVQLPPEYSFRGPVAAEELLLSELRRRSAPAADTSGWGVAAAGSRCSEAAPAVVSLAVAGTRDNGWSRRAEDQPSPCGLALGRGAESFLICGRPQRLEVLARSDRGLMLGVGIKLVDFKIEIGRVFEGDFQRLVIADEISPDSCRLWDIETGQKLDKDVFRRDLGNLADAYTEVARRLGVLPSNVTHATKPHLIN